MAKRAVPSRFSTILAWVALAAGGLLSPTVLKADDDAEQRVRAAEERAKAAEKRAMDAENRLKAMARKDARRRARDVDPEAEREASRRLDEMITRQYLRDAGRR
ncbi:MAG: hypothetical protein K2X43_08335 [Hyphomonadaceae bacterium]|jgi:hypothetical protein|nr:hypothetical protein [Hyphomonadaceae bacterium]